MNHDKLFTICEEKKKDCEEEATQGSFFKLGNKLSNSCFQSSEACFQSSNALPVVTLSVFHIFETGLDLCADDLQLFCMSCA
jgi:hypothetical protein